MFKDTTSFKLVSLIDKIKIQRKYGSIFLYLLYFIKFALSINLNIYRTNSNRKKIKLFLNLFKERFYLENIIKSYNMNRYSNLNYTMVNDILVTDITYIKSTIQFHIEYNIIDEDCSIFVITDTRKGINITEDNLSFKLYYDIFISALKMISEEVQLILNVLIYTTIKEVIDNVL